MDTISPFPLTPGSRFQHQQQLSVQHQHQQNPIQPIFIRRPTIGSPEIPAQFPKMKPAENSGTRMQEYYKEQGEKFSDRWIFENVLGITKRDGESDCESELKPKKEEEKKFRAIQKEEKSGLSGKKRVNIFPGNFERNQIL